MVVFATEIATAPDLESHVMQENVCATAIMQKSLTKTPTQNIVSNVHRPSDFSAEKFLENFYFSTRHNRQPLSRWCLPIPNVLRWWKMPMH